MRMIGSIYHNLALVLMLAGIIMHTAYSQDKHRVRLKADYFKEMGGNSRLEIGAAARIDRQNVDLPGLEITVVNEIGEEEITLGSVRTDHNGKGILTLDLSELKADSLDIYTLNANFSGTDTLRRASRSVSFRDADLIARLIIKDSVHHITATLRDKVLDSALADKNVIVRVERLFRPLRISDEINLTDEDGTILVPIPSGIPGVDGKLRLESVLSDSDDYGTIKATLDAPIGIPIVDESTFDDRTLWSPRNRTPIFILLFTGGLILVTWGTIIYLIRTLIKIAKH